MRLKCIATVNGSPFKVGVVYDVVEILEAPGHCMVRLPNGNWPKPVNKFFGWHPEEIFSSPRKGIGLPAVSCRCTYDDFAYFGFLVLRKGRTKRTMRVVKQLQESDNPNRPFVSRWRGIVYPVDMKDCVTIGYQFQDIVRLGSLRKAKRILLHWAEKAGIQSRPQMHYPGVWRKTVRDPVGLRW